MYFGHELKLLTPCILFSLHDIYLKGDNEDI